METVFTVFDHHYYVYLSLCVTFFLMVLQLSSFRYHCLAMFARPDRRKKEGGRGAFVGVGGRGLGVGGEGGG